MKQYVYEVVYKAAATTILKYIAIPVITDLHQEREICDGVISWLEVYSQDALK